MTTGRETKKLLALFANDDVPTIPPVWLMRQAGRYLPEYRELREEAGNFLDLCYTPELAEAATLQPIRRFDFDAAILFADILLIPHALGQKLWFETGEGPRLTPIASADTLKREGALEKLSPVFETLQRLAVSLPESVACIGFAGAPWTVATYMVAGRGTRAPARALAREDPDALQSIIDAVGALTIDYLAAQVAAGAEVLQIFESWAEGFDAAGFERWCVRPVAEIIAGLRARGIDVPNYRLPARCGRVLCRLCVCDRLRRAGAGQQC